MAFDPLSLGIGAVTGGLKLGLAAVQGGQAARLRFADTTTPEQREALAIARQRAAFGRLPGAGLAQARLAQGQSTSVQNATLGAGSSSDLLASIAAADRTRQNGELQLGAQGAQYNERAQAGLTQQLGLQAQQRQRDLASFNQQKAALTGAAIENASAAVDTGAAYAAYGFNKGADATGTTLGATSPGIRGANLPGYSPSLDATAPAGIGLRNGYYGQRRTRYPGLQF